MLLAVCLLVLLLKVVVGGVWRSPSLSLNLAHSFAQDVIGLNETDSVNENEAALVLDAVEVAETKVCGERTL
jgi:hypothetical protein